MYDQILIRHPTKFAAVTPSDATDLSSIATKGLWVGTGGDLIVKGASDTVAVTLKVLSGQYVPGNFSRVMAATTATNIVAFGG